jgi:paraquat-inducible protein A
MTVACPDCDLLQRLPELPPGGQARCVRCRGTLASRRSVQPPTRAHGGGGHRVRHREHHTTDGLSVIGRSTNTTIGGGAYQMWQEGERLTAVVVAFCAVIAPGGYILFMLTVLLAARRPPVPVWIGEVLRGATFMQPWSMGEVMILGILVALIKIAEMATVEPGIGMYAMGGLVVLLAAISMTFEVGEVWTRVQWANR